MLMEASKIQIHYNIDIKTQVPDYILENLELNEFLSNWEDMFEEEDYEKIAVDLYTQGDAFVFVKRIGKKVVNTESFCIKDKFTVFKINKILVEKYDDFNFYVDLENPLSLRACETLVRFCNLSYTNSGGYRHYYKKRR